MEFRKLAIFMAIFVLTGPIKGRVLEYCDDICIDVDIAVCDGTGLEHLDGTTVSSNGCDCKVDCAVHETEILLGLVSGQGF